MNESEWEEWCAALPREEREVAHAMLIKVADLGSTEDLRGVIWSELDQGAPELARFLLLRRIWLTLIRSWSENDNLRGLRAIERLVDQGVDLNDLKSLAQEISYETVFGLLYLLDLGHDDTMSGMPGWRLLEVDSDRNSVGRSMGGLHESLLGADPTGNEGMDFLD
ncbi:hypothetical protein HII36_14200 [Nonomuraea sp. NN258]|uniref:hypothetical protein n=1 Tax=Nonomuraea antri TaxID=2730852 RepID=UPI0015699F32|nr:hypothetical protein [Nonomuraea antri]NRQ32983.1 hypothetical protein [Nonomuraea antri]